MDTEEELQQILLEQTEYLLLDSKPAKSELVRRYVLLVIRAGEIGRGIHERLAFREKAMLITEGGLLRRIAKLELQLYNNKNNGPYR